MNCSCADSRGRGSTLPEVKSAPESTRPESTRPSVFSEHSASYMIYGLFCIIFPAKSQMNIKQLLTNIVVKLLIDQIEGELAT